MLGALIIGSFAGLGYAVLAAISGATLVTALLDYVAIGSITTLAVVVLASIFTSKRRKSTSA